MPQNVFVILNFYIINLILLLLGITNLLLHGNIGENLNKRSFNFSHELQILKIIHEKHSIRAQLLYERYLLLFIIVYMVPHSNVFFIVASTVIAVFLLRPLNKVVNYYGGIREIIKVNPKWAYVNHFVLIGLSIPLYMFLSTSLPAFICSYLSSYLIYEFKMRHCRYFHTKIEQTFKSN